MRSSSFVVLVFLSSSLAGCGLGIAREAPPPAPPQIEPRPPDLPTEPPGPGQARVVLDAEGEPAKVSRVVATMNYEAPRKARLDATTSLAPMRAEEPLCVTPCAVDLRHGSHTFVFTSMRDPLRSSTSEVVLPSNAKATFVRHAIGKEGHLNGAYVGGAMMLLMGAGLTLFGAAVTSIGAFGKPTLQDDGTMSDPQALLLPGSIVFGSGMLITIGGAVLMSNNRPVQQPGTTTSWVK